MKSKTRIIVIILALLFTLIVLSRKTVYDKDLILESFSRGYKQRSNYKEDKGHKVIFPKSFRLEHSSLSSFLKGLLNESIESGTKLLQQDQELQIKNEGKYTSYKINIYNSAAIIFLSLKNCKRLKSSRKVRIDEPRELGISITDLLTRFIEEGESDPYYQELFPFFLTELKLQLQYGVVDKYWYRLAGSSVWLEEYGVHFMISRLIYAPSGHRNQPLISLTLCQLYTRDWVELVNTKLVVPTNSLEDDNLREGDKYKVLKFPHIMNVPFWHDYDQTDGKYYGPEDPRIMLVKNLAGYEEPLVVFNLYHRKVAYYDDDDDDVVLYPNYHRSIFICWPWQFQRGKANVNGIEDEYYNNRIYNRVLELNVQDLTSRRKQKNWSPFVSEKEREENGHDKFVYFVYRWSSLEILKCNIADNPGECVCEYKLNEDLSLTSDVGALRGGTELININELLKTQNSVSVKDVIIPTREIWVGFARTHLSNCGCGKNIYRPNLVVLMKDSILGDSGKTTNVYKVSHISSSVSFNVEIIGWNLDKPKEICSGSNVLIPNGISAWKLTDLKPNPEKGRLESDDELILSFSISDATVHVLTIKGLLNMLLQLDDSFTKELRILKSMRRSDNYKRLKGYNDDNIYCALRESWDICTEYGEEYRRHKMSILEADTDKDGFETRILNPPKSSMRENVERYENELYYAKINKLLEKNSKNNKL